MIMSRVLQADFIPGWAEELMLDLDICEYARIIKLNLWSGILDCDTEPDRVSECSINPKRIVSMFIKGEIYEYEARMYNDLSLINYMDLEGYDDIYPYDYVDYSSFGGVLDLAAYGPTGVLKDIHLRARNGHAPIEEFEKPPLFEESWYRRMCAIEDVFVRVFETETDCGFMNYVNEFEIQQDEMEAPVCSG